MQTEHVSGGRLNESFFGSPGRWAGEQMLKCLSENTPLTAAALRTCDTLRKDEWKQFDEALVEEGVIRLRAVADLMAAGLTIPVSNGLGKTILEYEKVTDMDPAVISLDGLARGDSDRQTFQLSSIPLPITHKDFNISIRTLSASRERGEPLDTTQVRTAGRLVAESIENTLFNGGPTFGGSSIPGLTTQADRNTGPFGTAVAWSAAATTGQEILTDILTMITSLQSARFYGPYWMYIPGNTSTKFSEDFKSNSDKTIRDRMLQVDELSNIRVVDQLAADNIIMFQATQDVVAMVDSEPLQTIQWDLYGGFQIAFKAMAIQVPLVRSTEQLRSGIFHMS